MKNKYYIEVWLNNCWQPCFDTNAKEWSKHLQMHLDEGTGDKYRAVLRVEGETVLAETN